MTVSFNLSQLANSVNSSGLLSLGTGVTSTLPVTNGGTGVASATAYAVQCAGTTSTGAHQSIASVGTSGQVLTSNGAGALPTFQSATGSEIAYDLYTTGSGNWTCPAGVTKIYVILIGGGGGSSYLDEENQYFGGAGGVAIGVYTVVPTTNYAYTIGVGGLGSFSSTGATGGTSTFASFCSATGGTGLFVAGVGTNGTFSNWNSFPSVGNVFMGNIISSQTSPTWTPASGYVPGAGAKVWTGVGSGYYGISGALYIQYAA